MHDEGGKNYHRILQQKGVCDPTKKKDEKNPPQSTDKHRTLREAIADAIAEVDNSDDGHEFSEA